VLDVNIDNVCEATTRYGPGLRCDLGSDHDVEVVDPICLERVDFPAVKRNDSMQVVVPTPCGIREDQRPAEHIPAVCISLRLNGRAHRQHLILRGLRQINFRCRQFRRERQERDARKVNRQDVRGTRASGSAKENRADET
jgi:hypothetical protein